MIERSRGWLCAAVICFLLGASLQARETKKSLTHHLPAAVASGQARVLGALPASRRLHLSIVLPLRNQAGLARLLNRLADPSSPDYRHFLSVNEFTEQFGPSAEDYQKVVDFARSNGFVVNGLAANRLVLPVSATVDQIQKAFTVTMRAYQHPAENREFFSPDREPSIAPDVPIVHVSGLNDYSQPRPMLSKPAAQGLSPLNVQGSGPGGSYLASDMRAAYYGGTALTGAGQTVGLVEFDGYNLSDVDLAFGSVGQSYQVPIQNVLLDGQTGSPAAGGNAEVVLDIVQAIGMAPGLSQVRVYIGSNDADILNAVAGENLAKQVSISWSWAPDDPAIDDIFFMEMVAQGQSVFAASGDYGAYAPIEDWFFPAEDDYVTAVGGTHLTTAGAAGAWAGESAWDQSGGGISPDGFPMPAWQSGVANANNLASTAYRNVPDVAMEADGDNYNCSMGACGAGWGGTSFAAPRWAAFTALINQQALANGNPPLGFVNPLIYSLANSSLYPLTFHDITAGSNQWVYQNYGNNAVAGYDLVTGWGSPNGQSLIDQLAPGAAPEFTISPASSSLTILPGGSVDDTILVHAQASFNGSVDLSISGLPAGLTAAWSVNPASGGGTILTLTASSQIKGGSYLLAVTGLSGGMSAAANIAVQVAGPEFYIAPDAPSLQIMPGGSTSTAIEIVKENGFDGDVELAVTSSLPEWVTSSWVSDPATGENLLVFTTTGAGSPPASGQPISTMVTITGTSGDISATTTVALTEKASGIMVIPSPLPLVIADGQSVTSTVYALPWGTIDGEFTFSAPALPSGVSATFNPVKVRPGEASVMTVTADASAPTGASVFDVQAASAAGVGGSTIFTQNVEAAPEPTFTLAASSVSIGLNQSGTTSTLITETDQNGWSGAVSLSALVSPGIHAAFAPVPETKTTALTLTADADAATGTFLISVYGSAGSMVDKAVLQLTVSPAPAFSLRSSPATITLVQGSTATAEIAIAPQTGFSGSVTLGIYGLPDGVTAGFDVNPASASSELTLAANSSVAPGAYNVTISGKAGEIQSTLLLQLQVVTANIPTATALASSASTVVAGASVTLTATVTAARGAASGNVSFYNGTSLLGTVASDSSGVAALSTANLPVGSDTLTAVYAGNSTYVTSTSPAIQVTVAAPSNPQPVIASLTPALTKAGSAAFTLTIQGSNFLSSSTVYWGSTALATTYVSASQLTAQVPASAINATGACAVTVATPAPGGGVSNAFAFQVDSAASGSSAAPSFSSTSVSVQAGSAASLAVTLPAQVTSVSVSCLNLPAAASCSYAPSTNQVTIATGSATPAGAYPVTVVFSETVTEASSGYLLLPWLLLPVLLARKRLAKNAVWLTGLLALALLAGAMAATGCAGNSPSTPISTTSTTSTTSTQLVITSAVVSLTVQ